MAHNSQAQSVSPRTQEQETIIAALCADATTNTVRNCLRKYDPSKTSYQIEKELKKDKKEVLVAALEYLGVPDMNQYKAEALPHELVCRIQNLLPDTCHLCHQIFCIKIGERPIVSCVRCGQGCHNSCVLQMLGKSEEELNSGNNYGADIVNPYSTLGLFYLCEFCQKDVIPKKEELRVRQAKGNISHETAPHNSQTTRVDPAGSVNDAPQRSSQQQNDESNATSETVIATVINHEQISQNYVNNQGNYSRETNTRPVCKHYKTGRCKHGISGKKDGTCNYSHPKACSKFLTNGTRRSGGCNRGDNCRFFHPSMCHSSLRDRTCLRDNCKFMHVKGTRRDETYSPDPQARQSSQRPFEESRVFPNQSDRHQQTHRSTEQPRNSNGDASFSFLEHLKAIQEQMSHMTSKLQQLDANYHNLCFQNQGYPIALKHPLMQKPITNQPQMGQQMAYSHQALGSSLGLPISH